MFSRQAKLLDALREFLPGEAVDILKDVLCNGHLRLEHRGKLCLTHHTEDDVEEAALWMSSLSVARLRGKLFGAVRMAKIVPHRSGGDTPELLTDVRGGKAWWAYGRRVTDHQGYDPGGAPMHILLSTDQYTTPLVEVGDVIAYSYTDEGMAAMVQPPGGAMQLVYCTADVTQATGGNLAYISGKKCTLADGSDYDGDTLTVKFPPTHGGQPAVFTGDVIVATKDSAGDWYAASDYGDDYINSIKMWSGAVATLPVHWQFCDGTNSSPDLRGRFIVCADFDTVSPAHTANHTDEDVGDKSDDSGVGGYDNIEVDWRRISGVEPENPGSGCTVLYGSGPAVDAPGAGYRVGDLISVNGTVCICKVEAIDGSGGVTAVSFVSGSATWTGSLATTGANGVPVVSDVKNNPAMTGDTPDDKWSGTLPSASTTIKAVDNRPRYYALAYIMRWK